VLQPGEEEEAMAWQSTRFERGLSLTALEELAAREDSLGPSGEERCITEMWRYVWAMQTLPMGWKLEMVPDPLTEEGEGDWDSWRQDFPDAPESARHSRLYKYISPAGEALLNKGPEGTTTIYHLMERKDRDEPASSAPKRTGKTTHVCSYPWAMSFRGIVRAIRNALRSEGEAAFLFLDVLSDGSHDILHQMDARAAEQHEATVWLQHKRRAIESVTGVVQVCSQWNNPERLSRAWMLLEMVMAVTTGTPLIFAMEPEEQEAMASAMGRPASDWQKYDADANAKLVQGWQLWEDESNEGRAPIVEINEVYSVDFAARRQFMTANSFKRRAVKQEAGQWFWQRGGGPEEILDIVFSGVRIKQEKVRASKPSDVERVMGEIQRLAGEKYGAAGRRPEEALRLLEEELANSTRKTYATAIAQSFADKWALSTGGGEENGQQPADVLDLGHQLAVLWAMTDDQERAKTILKDVLADLMEKPPDWNEGKVARRDRTAAALVQLLLPASAVHDAELSPEDREKMMKEAHIVEKEALGGELAVSFQGVSVAFLQKFAEEHNESLNFLSTDAVVERAIKPASEQASVIGPGKGQHHSPPPGKAFIETLHEGWKGPPTFFLSHAWRQTFHVAGCPWRGGVVQALLQSVRCDGCKNGEQHSDLEQRETQAQIKAATEAGEYAKLAGADGLVAQLEQLECSKCVEKRRTTFVWFDIFCVNQHLRSPHGGLQGFAFDPLRNAIVTADHVEMFLETWDDPATLSRVWCLEELRVAMLMGKKVRICMPAAAMKSFRERVRTPRAHATLVRAQSPLIICIRWHVSMSPYWMLADKNPSALCVRLRRIAS
jgi:hypothetical protein